MLDITKPKQLGLSKKRLNTIKPYLNAYVDEGKLAGCSLLVARKGKPAYIHTYGLRDVDAGLSIEEDTIFRIYSMTKPITSVALLMLYEQGLFQLNDPISRFIPALGNRQVLTSGDADNYYTLPAEREITIHDLLTHTSGLAYGIFEGHPVDTLYSRREVAFGSQSTQDLIDKLADLPLLFSPGQSWHYSIATDVLGYLIEVISGQPLDQFFTEKLFKPLGMVDTGFYVPKKKQHRFAACYDYSKDENGNDSIKPSQHNDAFLTKPGFLSGGGGLVSTLADYFHFSQMLLNKGTYNGKRFLGRKTVELMTRNHLPRNADLSAMGMPVFSETPFDGIGFGLGVSVTLNPSDAKILGSAGEYAWGGLASTSFWNDPEEEMTVIFMTQLIPSSSYQMRRDLRVLTYQALV